MGASRSLIVPVLCRLLTSHVPERNGQKESTLYFSKVCFAVQFASFVAATVVAAQAQTAILTAQFNNSRTAANQTENSLNTSNVNVESFGKLFTFPVDGYVYAQPLYVPGLKINGVVKNVLYVATMQNSIYAFDADNPKAPSIFHVSLGTPVPAHSSGCPSAPTTGPVLGILSTPTIDMARNLLFAVSATPNGTGTYIHQMFGLDIRTGQIREGPVAIEPTYPGNGTDSQNGQVVMNQVHHAQRPGLLLSQGTVYAGFGSCGPDPSPYHGWIVGYNARTLAQKVVYNASPDGDENAIWQSGRGLVADAIGNIYAMTGNGSDSPTTNMADSFLKLSRRGNLIDWFTPSDHATLDQYDLDLASSGPILTPDTNLLVGGGKEGIVYVLNPLALGMTGAPVQQFQGSRNCGTPKFNGCYQIHSVAYLSAGASMFYLWGAHDNLRSFHWSGGGFVPAAQNSLVAGYPGSMLAVSSSGGVSGTSILWAVDPSGVVHAYDALDVATELWNSTQDASRDSLGTFAKFGQPIIADGRVYVPTFSNTVVAYGLLQMPAAPSNLTADFVSRSVQTLSWTDNSNDETGFGVERSTDGVNFNQIATVAANVTAYKDKSLSRNTTYYYRVRALHPSGDSGYSNVTQNAAF